MWRWIFNIVGVVSLVLSLAVGGMWVRSFWRGDSWGYEGAVVRGKDRWGGNVDAAAGTVQVEWWKRPDIGEEAEASRRFGYFSSNVDSDRVWNRRNYTRSLGGFQFLGLVMARHEFDPRTGPPPRVPLLQVVRTLIVPYWMLAVFCGVLPVVWLMSVRKWRRRRYREKNGLCLICGYDLRASQGRCPECGTAIPVCK